MEVVINGLFWTLFAGKKVNPKIHHDNTFFSLVLTLKKDIKQLFVSLNETIMFKQAYLGLIKNMLSFFRHPNC